MNGKVPHCSYCKAMFPAQWIREKRDGACQLGEHLFCSRRCLINFQEKPPELQPELALTHHKFALGNE